MLAFSILLSLTITFSACNQAEYDNAMSSESAAEAVTDSYSSEESSYEEEKRKVIKTANISLEVDQLENSILELKTFLKPINGYVYNYKIENHSYEIDYFQKNMDSTTHVKKVSPQGNLSVRVPIQFADSFINFVLQNEAQIASLQIGDEDVTENLWEKKQISNVYSNSGKAQNHKGNSRNIGYDNNTAIDAIRAKATAAKMDYKTKYLCLISTCRQSLFINRLQPLRQKITEPQYTYPWPMQ